MPVLRALLVVLPLAASLAFVACGGRVGGGTGGSSSGGSGSGGGSGGEGSSCGGGCGSSSGTFPGCPSPGNVLQGGACLSPGQECAAGEPITCPSGNPLQSTCTCLSDGTWGCDLGGPGCPITGCPVASSIVGGQACQTAPSLSCPSSMRVATCSGAPGAPVDCECESGFWACSEIEPVCDAGTGCPPPAELHAGDLCASSGEQCPGNPQACDGETLFDAFECEAGQWRDVAHTVCDVDAHGR